MQIPPALRYRRFTLFWVGLFLAWTGNQLLIWSIPWQISSFTTNPAALGSIGLIRLVPTIFVSLFAGVIADRVSRRKIVTMTHAIMGGTALLLGILTITKTIQLWHIYLMLVIHATAIVIDLPARFSLTPNLVPKSILPNALSLEVIAFQIGGIFGPILNGIIINQIGEQGSYLIAAGLFATMPIALMLMGPVKQKRLQKVQSGVDWVAIKEGIRFTFRQPLILSCMLLDFFATLLTRADSLLPFFARQIFNVEGFQYGLLTAAPMIGAALSGTILSQFKQIRSQGKLLLGAVSLIGLAAVIFGFSRSYLISVLALMLAGGSDSVSSIIRSAIRQLHTPDKLRGRMTSVNQIFFMGGPYLGDVKSGFLGGLIGVPLAVALGGIACILSVGWVSQRWPELKSYTGTDVPIVETA
jgi:MFS family permease